MPSRYDPPTDDRRDADIVPTPCAQTGCPHFVLLQNDAFCPACLRRHEELRDRLQAKRERELR